MNITAKYKLIAVLESSVNRVTIVIPAKAGIYLNRFRVKRFDRHELTAEWPGMTLKRQKNDNRIGGIFGSLV